MFASCGPRMEKGCFKLVEASRLQDSQTLTKDITGEYGIELT